VIFASKLDIDAGIVGTGFRLILDVGQKKVWVQAAQAQPSPHGQFCAGVCGGGQKKPPEHSEQGYPKFGQGWVNVDNVGEQGDDIFIICVKDAACAVVFGANIYGLDIGHTLKNLS
jgi:hypothetical protein